MVSFHCQAAFPYLPSSSAASLDAAWYASGDAHSAKLSGLYVDSTNYLDSLGEESIQDERYT